MRYSTHARVAKLADALDLGSSGATHGSSSLPSRTNYLARTPQPDSPRRTRNSPRSPFAPRCHGRAQSRDIALGRLRVDVVTRALHRLTEIVLGRDVVAVEDGARLVPADLHRHALADTGPHHVAHTAAPEVVEEPGRHPALAAIRIRAVHAIEAGLDAGRRPRAAEVADRPTGPVKHELGDALRLSGAAGDDASLGAALDDGAEVALDR